jgi:hypothetical protein
MRSIKLVSVFLFSLTLILSSCNSDALEQESEMQEALLVWSGEYMVDGCGFHVVINDKKYKPEDENAIDDMFKTQPSTAVLLSYKPTGEIIDRRCGLATESKAMDGIRILDIKKRP